MSKKAKTLLIGYVLISLLDIFWFWAQQKKAYKEGHGYLLSDVNSFICLIIITILYGVAWYAMAAGNNLKKPWLIFFISVLSMFFIGGLIWSINTIPHANTSIFK